MKKRHIVIRFVIMAAAVTILTLLIVKLCNYLLLDDTARYTRLTMHEFYEAADEGENIDVLFLGSSHAIHAYDPETFTELTGKSAFNLGSSSQNYDTSYYLLREAAKYNDLDTVYLDMHYKFLFIGKEDRDLVQADIITDYMRWSSNKIEFMLTTSEASEYSTRFLPFRRNWTSLWDLSYISEVAAKKNTEEYREYEPIADEDSSYAGLGFIWSDTVLDADAITWWDNFGDISEDMADQSETYSLEYIGRIVEFCEDSGIDLVFVTAPSFDRYLEEVGPYSEAHNYIQALADSYGVAYLDFNQADDEYFNPSEEWFSDVDHMNGAGALALTTILAEIDLRMDGLSEESGSYDEELGALIDEYFDPCYD